MDDRELQGLLGRLRSSPLKVPARLAVMTVLVARDEIEFAQLQRILGLTPGNLWSHLDKLRREGYLSVSYRPSLQGPRLVVKPTRKGIEETLTYLRAMNELASLAGESVARREQEPE